MLLYVEMLCRKWLTVCMYISRKYFFSNRVINRWNQLDQGAVVATSVSVFKSNLERLRYTRVGFFTD